MEKYISMLVKETDSSAFITVLSTSSASLLNQIPKLLIFQKAPDCSPRLPTCSTHESTKQQQSHHQMLSLKNWLPSAHFCVMATSV